ncbi:MAG: hypothetical protein IT260_17560, partial [Saprospiraceae bacterium]|nr:hypothetical protein [Saprospiraceae bacterium]
MSELARQIIADNKAKHQRGEDASVLDLGNCGLSEVPEEVGECVWVKSLILSAAWHEFDLEKKRWRNIQSSNTGEANQLAGLPAWLPELEGLEQLMLNKQPVSDLSPLAALTNLQTLFCESTQVSDLSPLAALTN